ncbi:MAG: TatD family hydrolase [Lentisphaeria bacterium]|nr:TatD family hydrolase [Lentisphaeria bacterium]
MELFDTHFHFDGETEFEAYMAQIRADLELTAPTFNVPLSKLYMLCAGGSWTGSKRAMEFAGKIENGYFSAGVHPHDAEEYRQQGGDFSIFRNEKKLLAIGEIGLDYFYDLSDRNIQQDVLQEFLDLALAWNLPAMLHLRDKDNVFDAYSDALNMLEPFSRAGGRFVIHCYAGNEQFAEKFLDLGGYFGVTGLYTFKAADNIRSVIARLPAERLLTETDSPYLAPVPYRGRTNTPGMVGLVAARLGSDLNMTPEAAADFFTANGKRFYGI